MDLRNIQMTLQDVASKDPMQILEDALIQCKFGKFHFRLMAASMCSTFALIFVTTTSSYILPVAECDLNMNMIYKGLLNAAPFIGQMGASLFTGFLVDAFGRKLFLVGGNAGIFICAIIEGSSQSYWMLMFTKFIQGISFSLCFSAMTTNISEFCHIKIRDRMLLLYSVFSPLAMVATALVAWIFLPLKINIVIWSGLLEIHAWNIFLYACSIWSFVAFLLYYFLPESPKFLLSHAREKEAMEVLKAMYYENTGFNKDSFPVLSFNTSGILKPTVVISVKKQLVNALFQVKELFRRPLIFKLLLFSFMTLAGLLAFTSLRLWLPQLSTMVENYKKDHGDTAQFCVMVNEYMHNSQMLQREASNMTKFRTCVPKLSGPDTYINGIIIGSASILFVAISAALVDRLGSKLLMFIMLISSIVCSLSLYWTDVTVLIAILISATCGLLQTVLNLQQNLFVRVFPTNLRALAISIIMMVGRIGSLSGNVLFPMLLDMGCMAPFISIAIISTCVAALTYFLPNVNKDNRISGDK